MTQQGVDKILRSEFAPLSFECIIGREIQTFFHFECESRLVG